MGGKYGDFWEMTTGGPYKDDPLCPPQEIFKCKKCGAETRPASGYNGEPDRHICGPDCRMEHSDLKIGPTEAFIKGYPLIDWSKGKKTNFARMR